MVTNCVAPYVPVHMTNELLRGIAGLMSVKGVVVKRRRFSGPGGVFFYESHNF